MGDQESEVRVMTDTVKKLKELSEANRPTAVPILDHAGRIAVVQKQYVEHIKAARLAMTDAVVHALLSVCEEEAKKGLNSGFLPCNCGLLEWKRVAERLDGMHYEGCYRDTEGIEARW